MRRLFLCLLISMISGASGGDYFAQNILEPDKIGTAWLLKRFVDPEAKFFFVPKDSVIPGAVSFDTPTSKYRRYPKYSAAMSVIRFNSIKDSGAVKIAKLIDEIELGFWGEEKSKQAKELQDWIMKSIQCENDANVVLDKCFSVLDSITGIKNDQ